MHSCVSAAGSSNLHWSALDFGNHLFEGPLYGKQTRLELPAVIIRAVVGNLYANAPAQVLRASAVMRLSSGRTRPIAAGSADPQPNPKYTSRYNPYSRS